MRTPKTNSNIAVDKKQQQKQQQPLHTHLRFSRGRMARALDEQFPTSKTLKGMGTSFEGGDFWDHLGGQKSVMSGR